MKNAILVENLTVLLKQYGVEALRTAFNTAISNTNGARYSNPPLTKDELVNATIKTITIYGGSKEMIKQQLSKIPYEMSLEDIDKRMTKVYIEMEQKLRVHL